MFCKTHHGCGQLRGQQMLHKTGPDVCTVTRALSGKLRQSRHNLLEPETGNHPIDSIWPFGACIPPTRSTPACSPPLGPRHLAVFGEVAMFMLKTTSTCSSSSRYYVRPMPVDHARKRHHPRHSDTEPVGGQLEIATSHTPSRSLRADEKITKIPATPWQLLSASCARRQQLAVAHCAC